MNFLAHIYLSGPDDQIRIGNFMADGIRGKDYEQFPSGIRKGILLHRAIDAFTDTHPLFRQGTKRLHQKYHHYAGVIMDMFYDHFLAKNWAAYSAEKLNDYAAAFYRLLYENYELLTARAKAMLPYMKEHDWLVSYASVDGLTRILSNMDRRAGNGSRMAEAPAELLAHYDDFEREFTEFFEQIRNMSKTKLQMLQE
jgi:acyl carrier protein phosphodiesterase